MITLGSIREYISSLNITEDEHVYMGTLDAKQEMRQQELLRRQHSRLCPYFLEYPHWTPLEPH